jgi:hypothetical protein
VGLHFDILSLEPDTIWERRGRVQRKAGIRAQWFHHPDAVRVPEPVFSNFSNAFRVANPAFNYYGPTEYTNQETARLCCELRAGSWGVDSGGREAETKIAIQSILTLAEEALANGKSLLVLGI